MRGTRHASSNGQAPHLLAAADQQAGAVFAQAEVDGKTNEITAFAPLLEPLDLAGAVVTADALHATPAQMAQWVRSRWGIEALYVIDPGILRPIVFSSGRGCLILSGVLPR